MARDRMRIGNEPDEQPLPEDLQALFASYREALPDPEPGAQFMPGVWARIEPQRSFAWSFRKAAKALVTAAVGACLAMSLFLSASSPLNVTTRSYVDVLDDHNNNDDAVEISELL